MKKILFVLMALMAVFIAAYYWVGDVNYNVDMFLIHSLDNGDGVYCTTYRCAELIHEHADLWHRSEDYMKVYGPNDPGRPSKLFKYDNYLNAYVRWFK